MARLFQVGFLLAAVLATSGCVPVAVGAGGAIAADTVAEERGGNLF